MRSQLMGRCHIGCARASRIKPMSGADRLESLDRRLVREAEYFLGRAEARQRELAAAMLCELARSQDPAPQRAGQLFDARGAIDSRTDAGEIEPIAAADIAVEDIADMQGEAEAQPRHRRGR